MTDELASAEEQGTPDTELVQRARGGDAQAYGELVQRHHRRVYQLVYNMTSNHQDAEDLTQDAFVRAFRALDRFKGDSSFFTWVYRIAINRSINFIKSRRLRQAISLDDMDAGAERDPAYVELRSRESPVRDVGLAEVQKRLNEALLTLSEKHRTVAVMHDIQGMPHEEIAKIMKCSIGTVRSRLFYARQHLQRELKEFAP